MREEHHTLGSKPPSWLLTRPRTTSLCASIHIMALPGDATAAAAVIQQQSESMLTSKCTAEMNAFEPEAEQLFRFEP